VKILKLVYSGCVLLLIMIFSGCIAVDNQNGKATNTLYTVPATNQTNSTQTLLPSITNSVSPAATKTNTGIRPTRTTTSTPIPFTAFPTLDIETYQQKFHEWYDRQENCAFPCLWDITFESTDIHSVWKTVHDIFPDYWCQYESDGFSCDFSNFPISYESRIPITGLSISIKNQQVKKISIYGNYPNKSLSRIINDLGFPDEIYLLQQIGGDGYLISNLILIFNEYQAVVKYFKGVRMTSDTRLNFCLDHSDQPDIELFPEGKQIHFLELPHYSDIPYRLFSDVVGVSFSDYYQNHVSSDGALCIISNQDDW